MDNYLIVSDILDLEEAGLDVDELAEMDWGDRYDAIDEAGLNPMDYDYGFVDDYMKCDDEPVVPKKEVKRTSLFDMMLNTSAPQKPVQNTPKKMSRSERKRLQKITDIAMDELETDLMMFFEVMMDD
ncbi:MAG: hypothetical protein K6A71_03135 [Lachnospiraceae bacterium]|nr:hypothetical protein [Lachnospiraceae bacterium]